MRRTMILARTPSSWASTSIVALSVSYDAECLTSYTDERRIACHVQSRVGHHLPRSSRPLSSSKTRYRPPSWWDSSLAWRTWRAHDGRPRRGILSRAVALRYLFTQSQSKWYARLAMTLRARAEAMVRRRRSRRGGCWAQLAEKWYARGLVGARKQTQIPGASLSGELGFATVPSRIL